MRTHRITLLSGDGIGPVLAEELAGTLELLGMRTGFQCVLERRPFGREAYLKTGTPLPEETVESVRSAEAAIVAAVDAKDVKGPTPVGLLRKKLGLFADVRPIRARPGRWSLREDLDLVVVREITQGFLSDRNLHAGSGEWMSDQDTAFSLRVVTYEASRRIAEYAFDYAERNGRRRVTALHKASIFKQTCGTFLRACRDAAAAHPGIAYEEVVADNAANGLIAHPERYDVLLTTNLFGDILSDEAAALVSSLAPSVNQGPGVRVYLPITHSPAYEDLARDCYDPVPGFLCLHMLLRDLGETEAAALLDKALDAALRRADPSASAVLAGLREDLRGGKAIVCNPMEPHQ